MRALDSERSSLASDRDRCAGSAQHSLLIGLSLLIFGLCAGVVSDNPRQRTPQRPLAAAQGAPAIGSPASALEVDLPQRAELAAAHSEPALTIVPAQTSSSSAQVESVRIQIVGQEHGRPLQAASVELCFWPVDSEEALVEVLHTDAKGIIERDLGAGELRVVAWRGSMAVGPKFFDIEAGSALRESLALVGAHPIQGRVIDASNGLPVAGAEVAFRTFSERDAVLTDGDGWFRHPRFPRTEFAEQVHVTAPGYGTSIRYLSVADDGHWELPACEVDGQTLSGGPENWLELSLVPALSVRGRVLDADGAPIEGVEVSCEGFFRMLPDVASRDGQEARSDAAGEFLLEGLRSDISHGLVLSARGFEEVLLELEHVGTLCLELEPISMTRESLLAGVVVDVNGMPAEDISVELIRLGEQHDSPERESRVAANDVPLRIAGHMREERTDPLGVFLFERTRPASYRLVLSRGQQTLLELELDGEQVQAGQGLMLQLPAKFNTLVGRALDAPEGTRVELRRGDLVADVGLDSQGGFRVSGLDLEGPYELVLRGHSEDSEGQKTTWLAQGSIWAHELPVLQMQRTTAPSQGELAKLARK